MPAVTDVSEPVASYHDSRVQYDPVTDPATIRHRHVGMEHATLAELRPRSDGDAGHEYRSLSDPGVLPHVAMRIESRIRSDDGRRIDHGQGADTGRMYHRGIEQPVDAGKRAVGVVDSKGIQGGRDRRLVGRDHRAGLAGGQVPPVPRVSEKGDVSRTGVFDGRHPFDGRVRVADHPSADQLGEVRERFA